MKTFFFFMVTGVAIAAGCTSNNGDGDGGTDGAADTGDLCSQFTSVGQACPKISATLCFPQCTNGGCKCVGGPDGPVWSCTTDTSCMPCGSPLGDASNDCDASTDSSTVGDASDAAADASTDAASE